MNDKLHLYIHDHVTSFFQQVYFWCDDQFRKSVNLIEWIHSNGFYKQKTEMDMKLQDCYISVSTAEHTYHPSLIAAKQGEKDNDTLVAKSFTSFSRYTMIGELEPTYGLRTLILCSLSRSLGESMYSCIACMAVIVLLSVYF